MARTDVERGVSVLELDVVIVSYRCREHLRNCLKSLRLHPPRLAQMHVHVVDNSSADGTTEMVRDEFGEVELHALKANVGFSVGCNVAMRSSVADYLLLLNPDTEVTEGAIDHLIRRLRSRPDVGLIGPRLVLPDGTFDHASKRSFPTPLAAMAHFLRVGRSRFAPRSLGQYRAPTLPEDEVGEVDALNGAFMLARREALDEVGPLDEGYWLYMEDLDWCYRFMQSGWKVLYDGTVTVVHVKHGSTGSHRPVRHEVAFHRGMGRFYRTFYGGRHAWLDAAVYSAIGLKLAISLARQGAVQLPRAARARKADA